MGGGWGVVYRPIFKHILLGTETSPNGVWKSRWASAGARGSIFRYPKTGNSQTFTFRVLHGSSLNCKRKTLTSVSLRPFPPVGDKCHFLGEMNIQIYLLPYIFDKGLSEYICSTKKLKIFSQMNIFVKIDIQQRTIQIYLL